MKEDIVKRLTDLIRAGYEAHGVMNDARNEIERLRAENERLREALASSESWISRWAKHVGNCSGSDETCTCGRAAILFEARAALAGKEEK